MPPLLELRDATKRYGGGGLLGSAAATALEGVSLRLHADRPAIVAVVGESGSGKTTLARLILGLAEPTEGRVLYQGRDVAALPRAERLAFRRDVQAVFQDPYGVYNPFYRVDHVLETPVDRFGLASGRAAKRAMIEEALHAVGLRPEEILGRFPHQLSGGQRQRIMVARALLLKPRVVVADEPVSMVDASLRATILGSLRALRDERGISIVYITHDLATAFQIADTILVLYRARTAEAGDVAAVVRRPMHPYTSLLVGSIPLVSVDRTWGIDEPAAPAEPVPGACPFQPRCPAADLRCAAAPPLFRPEPARAVACWRHDASDILPGAALGDILIPEAA